MTDLATDYLDFRKTTDEAVRAAQALPPEIYLQTPPVEQGGAVPTAPAPPETQPTGAIPSGPLPALLPPPTAAPAPQPTAQAQAAELATGLGVQAALPRMPADLGLATQSLQAMAAYLPTGPATPLLQQAASGLDLLMNLTLIPARTVGAAAGTDVEAMLRAVGVDGKKVGDAVQALTELSYSLFQNPAGAITTKSVTQTLQMAEVLATAGAKIGHALKTAPGLLLGGAETAKPALALDAEALAKTLYGAPVTPEVAQQLSEIVGRTADETQVALPDVAEAVKAGARISQRIGASVAQAGQEAMRGFLEQRGLSETGQVSLGTAMVAGRLLLGALVGAYTGDTAQEQVRNALIGMGIAASPELVRLLTKGIKRELHALNAARPVTKPEKVLGITRTAPVPPGTASAGGNTLLNFDFERLAADPKAMWAAVDDLVNRRTTAPDAANFGALTEERIEKIAEIIGLPVEQITPLTGKILNVQQLDAAADVVVAAITALFDKNAQLQAAVDLGLPQVAELTAARDQQLVWTSKITVNMFEVAGELGSALKKWQDLLPVLREPMGQVQDLADLVQRGLVGSETVTSTLRNMTDKPVPTAPLLRRLWNGGWGVAASLFQNSLLSGFEAINLLGNVSMTADYLGTHVVAVATSTLKGLPPGERVHLREFPAMLYGASVGVIRGLGSAARIGAGNTPIGTIGAGLAAAKQGEPILAAMAQQARTITPSMQFGTSKVTFSKARAIGSDAFGLGGIPGLVADVIGQMVYIPSTLINMTDEVAKWTNREMLLYGEATNAAINKGAVSGEARRVFTKAFLHDPPQGIETLVNDTANLLTLTNTIPKYLKDVRTAMDHPAYRFIAPFWSSPMNLQRYNFAHWPVLGRYVDYQTKALAAGGRAAELAKARMLMGAGLIGTTAALVWNGDQGIEIPGMDTRVRFTGRGPSEPGERQIWQEERIPYSLGIQQGNGKWLELGVGRFDYPVLTMGLIADALNMFTKIHNHDLFEELVTAIGVSTWNNVIERSTLAGFANLFETFTADHPERYAVRSGRFIRHLVGSVVPMGVGQLEKHMSPEVKQVYGFMDQIASRLPIASESLDVKQDVLGDPIMRPLGYPPSLSLFSPVPAREVPGDYVRTEMLKNEVNVLPPPPYLFGGDPGRLGPTDVKEGIPLTTGRDSQYRRLLDLMTKAKLPAGVLARESDVPVSGPAMNMKDALFALMHTPKYKTVLSEGKDGGQAMMIRRIIAAYQNAAEGLLLKENPALLSQYAQKSIDRGNALVQPEYRKQRYEMHDTGTPSILQHLTR